MGRYPKKMTPGLDRKIRSGQVDTVKNTADNREGGKRLYFIPHAGYGGGDVLDGRHVRHERTSCP